MSEDVPVQVQKPTLVTNINIPTLLAIGGVLVTLVTGWNNLGSRITAIETSRVERSAVADQKFAAISAQLSVLPDMKLVQVQTVGQVAEQKAQIADVNVRIDRVVESLSGKMDTLLEQVNGLKTDVRLLGQKIDLSLGDDGRKPAAFTARP